MSLAVGASGRNRLADFDLDPGITYLNHGSYGATPRVVREAQAAWQQRAEADPTSFHSLDSRGLLRSAAAQVAAFLGGEAADWAFVDNATAGANAVIGSLRLGPGDRLLTTSHVYGAVRNAMLHFAARAGAEMVEVPLPLPYPGDGPLLEAVARELTPATRLAVFDHMSSRPATILPVEALIALCHSRGVPVLIDGAHMPGHMALDVPALGADYYVANLHKWAFAPRAAAVLYAAPAARGDLHPSVISHYWGQGFPEEFDWVGTRDLSAWLSAGDGIAFWHAQGGAELARRNRELARQAAEHLAKAWASDIAAPPEQRGAMASIALPINGGAADPAQAQALFQRLIREHRIVAPIFALDGRYWIRIAAQIYNEAEDYERLRRAIGRLL